MNARTVHAAVLHLQRETLEGGVRHLVDAERSRSLLGDDLSAVLDLSGQGDGHETVADDDAAHSAGRRGVTAVVESGETESLPEDRGVGLGSHDGSVPSVRSPAHPPATFVVLRVHRQVTVNSITAAVAGSNPME
jgi:hypothetical protein